MVAMRTFMLAATLCGAVASPCLANPADARVSAEIKAVLEQHNRAFNAQDLDGVMATYSPAPNTVLIGTGPGEAYVGGEGISGAYTQFFTKFKPNSIGFKYDWISTGSKGSGAWFAMTNTMSATTNQGPQERAFNMSGTLQKEKGQWRFVSLHFSKLGAEPQTTAEPPK
jgi:ketosteroid isomerase-like protein